MGLLEIFVIAVGLSMDSFAVSVVNGMLMPHIKFYRAASMAAIFAIFQGALPVLGYLAGSLVEKQIQSFDHWIAFGLLVLIGGKMVFEGWNNNSKEQTKQSLAQISWSRLVTQALATSIDALVLGIGFAFLETNILLASFIIGAVTFFFAMLGLRLGKAVGVKVRNGIEMIGGLMLIIIGFKTLFEHLL